jgi:glutamate 5-kinase
MSEHISVQDGLFLRQTLFDKARRIVVKVGSAVLTGPAGLDLEVIENISKEICFLHNSGREVILVSSGAVAAGKRKISFNPSGGLGIKEKQALAAIGQSSLMQAYENIFSTSGTPIAQILLTHADLAKRDRYLNVRNTLLTLFKFGVIPVINENDSVSVEELRFGDNDTLGAHICNLIEADMFICLTDVNGLYPKDPATDPDARPVYTVQEIDGTVKKMVKHAKSSLGSGGMQSKLNAANIVATGGGSSFIGPGREKQILQKLFSGQPVGTFFLPRKERISGRKNWIASVLKPQGHLELDEGACRALTRNNRSLLPSGVQGVTGEFGVGDAVHCLDPLKNIIAVGLINYSSGDCRKIIGQHSNMIEDILGYSDADELIHRDNIVLLKKASKRIL